MLMNTLLNTFGETLSSYVGGGTVAATGDGSVMDEMTLLAEGREMDTELLAEGAVPSPSNCSFSFFLGAATCPFRGSPAFYL